MQEFLATSRRELDQFLSKIDQPPYRSKQVWDSIYKRFHLKWSDVSNIPPSLIHKLNAKYRIMPLETSGKITSNDGNTTKILFTLDDGNQIETVLLRNRDWNTICISSQVGCPAGCDFCVTGQMGFKRNLSSTEIIAQVLYINHILQKKDQKINNIVLMGMGEPFFNYNEVIKAIHIFNNSEGFEIGARKITVSTIGIVDRILDFASEPHQFNLAISIHAPNDNLRQKLIPIAKKYPLKDILEAAEKYVDATNRRITYEYVLIDKINSKQDHAKQLASLLKNQNCHVNLIALNPNHHYAGKPPSQQDIRVFSNILLNKGIPTTLRDSQGTQIKAGCGQLAGRCDTKKSSRQE